MSCVAQAGRSLAINVSAGACGSAHRLALLTSGALAQFRHHTAGTNVLTNFQKFSLGHLADAMIADAAHAPFRAGPIFDAIVTDRMATSCAALQLDWS